MPVLEGRAHWSKREMTQTMQKEGSLQVAVDRDGIMIAMPLDILVVEPLLYRIREFAWQRGLETETISEIVRELLFETVISEAHFGNGLHVYCTLRQLNEELLRITVTRTRENPESVQRVSRLKRVPNSLREKIDILSRGKCFGMTFSDRDSCVTVYVRMSP